MKASKFYFLAPFLVLFANAVSGQLLYIKSDTMEITDETIRFNLPEYRGEIQWQFSADAFEWEDIDGETSDVLIIELNDNMGHYRAKVTADDYCMPFYSDTASIIATVPTVVTSTINDITAISAVMTGEVTCNGGAGVSSCGFYWSETNSLPDNNDNAKSSDTGSAFFSESINNLLPGTTYYVRAYATNSEGTSIAGAESFTTLLTTPLVTTLEAIDFTSESMTLNGEVTSNGGTNIILCGFYWSSTNSSPGSSDHVEISKTSFGEFSYTLTGLEESTTYYVVAFAANSKGTTTGEVKSFSTLGPSPTINTLDATDITAVSVILNGRIIDSGYSEITEQGFYWSPTNPIPDNNDNILISENNSTSFSASINNLLSATTYYVVAYATNSEGTSTGKAVSFTTYPALPSVSTQTATEITTTSAVLNGVVTNMGIDEVNDRGFYWSITNSVPDSGDNIEKAGNGTGDFSSTISGLDPGTTCYAVAYATNSEGTSTGVVISFTTSAKVPTVTTLSASDISTASATLNGTVTSSGGAAVTSRGFYWSATDTTPDKGDNIETVEGTTDNFSATISYLEAGTTYYVVAYATNSKGTSTGDVISFITSAKVPTVTTLSASDITAGSVTLNGEVTSTGGAAVTSRGFYWSATNTTPDSGDNVKASGSGSGSFSATLSNLNAGETYYVVAYATNNAGTSTGEILSFSTENENDENTIILNETSITSNTSKAIIDGTIVTIISAGTYYITGTLNNGQVIVDSDDEEDVILILNGVNITCSSSAPVYVANAKNTYIHLADNTTNYITDGSSYVFESADEDEPNAAVFSKDDLFITGNGRLIVSGNFNDGIASKDELEIEGGTIEVTAIDDGVRGKDNLVITGGTISVISGGDGLKSDNDSDTEKGYISIASTDITVNAGGDAITAETNVTITSGDLLLTSGGGSSYSAGSDSKKGIKGVSEITIDGGTITISSADDAVHSNNNIVINGGIFTISSGDDGVHSDSTLIISGGTFDISKCYEGIESAEITINDGDIHIVASDDGLNVAGGVDNSGMGGWTPPGGTTTSVNYFLYLNGGYIVVDATGDGIDVNGSIVMTGGDVIVNGPTAQDNGAIDYDGSYNISGGSIVAAGSSGMAMAPGSSSSQYSVLVKFSSTIQAGKLFHIETNMGDNILTFAPGRSYQSVAFSSSDLAKGTYKIYLGGSCTGTNTDGLYQGGTYSGGTLSATFTISNVVTNVNVQ